MAVAEVRPGAAQCVVVMVAGKWDVVGQCGHDGDQPLVEATAVPATGLPLQSRLTARVRSMLRMEIVEQALYIVELGQVACASFLHGGDGFGVRHEGSERQSPIPGHAGEQEPDRVGDGEPHGGQNGGGLLLDLLVDARLNEVVRDGLVNRSKSGCAPYRNAPSLAVP